MYTLLYYVKDVNAAINWRILIILSFKVISKQVNTAISYVNVALNLSHFLFVQFLLFNGLLLPDVVEALASQF